MEQILNQLISIEFCFVGIYMIIASVASGIFLRAVNKPIMTIILAFFFGWLLFPVLLGCYLGKKFVEVTE